MAIVQPEEEDDAVEQGWLALDHDYKNKEVWYQSRSTRIDLRKYEPRFRKFEHDGKPLGMKTIEANEMVSLLGLPKIYRQYMKDKKFGADYDPFRFYHDRDRFLIFYIDSPDNIVCHTTTWAVATRRVRNTRHHGRVLNGGPVPSGAPIKNYTRNCVEETAGLLCFRMSKTFHIFKITFAPVLIVGA